MTYVESIHAALEAIPTSSLLDRMAVIDVLLDTANAASGEDERQALLGTIARLPNSAVLDRFAVTDLLLDLVPADPDAGAAGEADDASAEPVAAG